MNPFLIAIFPSFSFVGGVIGRKPSDRSSGRARSRLRLLRRVRDGAARMSDPILTLCGQALTPACLDLLTHAGVDLLPEEVALLGGQQTLLTCTTPFHAITDI